MKKITIFLLLVAPLFIFSQSYYMDFDTDDDTEGWTSSGLLLNTVSPNPSGGVLQADGQGLGTGFPGIRLPLASSPVGGTLTYSDYTVVRIVAENVTSQVTWQLINHDNGDNAFGTGEKTDFDMPIVTAGSGYTTFDIVLPANPDNATGIIDQIGLRAKEGNDPGVSGTLKIDQIVIINTITVEVVTNGTFEDGSGSLSPWTVNGPDISASLVTGNGGGNASRLHFTQDATDNNSYDNVVYDFGHGITSSNSNRNMGPTI